MTSRGLLLGVVLLLLPLTSAAEPYEVVIDWHSGRFLAGAPVGVSQVNFWRFPFAVDACRRELLLDAFFEPSESGVDVDGVGEVALLFDFRAEVWNDTSLVSSGRIRQPGYGWRIGITPTAGPYELHLILTTGVNVSWSARLRAHELPMDEACQPGLLVNEVEANPAGVDGGAEWVELVNPGFNAIDAGGWTLSVAGSPTPLVTISNGTIVDPGGFLKLSIPSGTPLADSSLMLEVESIFGLTTDVTPPLSDASDDLSTWQRTPDGAVDWAFRLGTPEATNGAP